MTPDEEGFLYPKVDKTACVDCHLCEKVCPILNVEPEKEFPQTGYIVQHKDQQILKESTSGGAFTAIASWVINQGGVVFGAAFDKNFVIHHTWVNKLEDLKRFRNSKYAQSEIRDSFRQTKAFLDEGKMVLFSGTPCQLEGLLRFLRKKYENLLTVDVVCRACPSPLVFKKYLEMQRQRLGGNMKNVLFRDKHYGYGYSSMTIETENGADYHEGIDTDSYLRAFFSEISIRPSCVECKFRKRYRETDFTIWDCFDIAEYCRKLNNDKGATKVLAHTEKAKALMPKMKDIMTIVTANPKRMLKMGGVNEINITLTAHPLRKKFFEDINNMPPQEAFEKYFPIRFRNKMEKHIRILTYKLGVYDLIKKLYVRFIGRDNIQR